MVEEIFDEALARFLAVERELIARDASERSLCCRLAMKLENSMLNRGIEGYYVDTDYNRNQGGKIKTIVGKGYRVIEIYADIIMHSRGAIPARDNLLAIEMKKSKRRPSAKESDRERLRALTKSSYDGVWTADGKTLPEHVCGYELGVFIEIDIADMHAQTEFYKGGVYRHSRGISFGKQPVSNS
jgi:hypothetical protein